MQWYHKNGSLCFNWTAFYHAYRGFLRKHDQSRNTCLVFSKSVQHIYSLLRELFFLNLQQSTNLSRFCYLNNMNYFYIFSGPLKEVDLIKFQITISVCFKLFGKTMDVITHQYDNSIYYIPIKFPFLVHSILQSVIRLSGSPHCGFLILYNHSLKLMA